MLFAYEFYFPINIFIVLFIEHCLFMTFNCCIHIHVNFMNYSYTSHKGNKNFGPELVPFKIR